MEHLVTLAIAMITIANPPGIISLFLSVTSDYTESEKHHTAVGASVAVVAILMSVTWTGSFILRMLGISTASLQVAGGMIIGIMGLSMLQDKTSDIRYSKRMSDEVEIKESIVVVPLALPMIIGPGIITTLVTATENLPGMVNRLYITGICLGLSFMVFVSLYFAAPIGRMLGKSGLSVMSKIMGMLLTAIAVQMFTTGLIELVPGLAG